MKTITVNKKEYKIEFTIEASLYDECVSKVIDLMSNIFINAENNTQEGIKELLKSLSDIPYTTLVMFYAGLLENHSDEIQSIDDAKALIKILMRENKEDKDLSNFYGIMQILMECMSDDGFFKQIGLEQMLTQAEEELSETQVTPITEIPKKKTTRTTTTKPGKK